MKPEAPCPASFCPSPSWPGPAPPDPGVGVWGAGIATGKTILIPASQGTSSPESSPDLKATSPPLHQLRNGNSSDPKAQENRWEQLRTRMPPSNIHATPSHKRGRIQIETQPYVQHTHANTYLDMSARAHTHMSAQSGPGSERGEGGHISCPFSFFGTNLSININITTRQFPRPQGRMCGV